MKINALGLLLTIVAISSWKATRADELFEYDELDNELDTFDNKIDELVELLAHKNLCRKEFTMHYNLASERCLKTSCTSSCNIFGYTEGKCRKSQLNKVKKCTCYKSCKNSDSRNDSPAHTPVSDVSPIHALTPEPASPVNPPSSSAPEPASPVNPPSSPTPEPASPVNPPSSSAPELTAYFDQFSVENNDDLEEEDDEYNYMLQ